MWCDDICSLRGAMTSGSLCGVMASGSLRGVMTSGSLCGVMASGSLRGVMTCGTYVVL